MRGQSPVVHSYLIDDTPERFAVGNNGIVTNPNRNLGVLIDVSGFRHSSHFLSILVENHVLSGVDGGDMYPGIGTESSITGDQCGCITIGTEAETQASTLLSFYRSQHPEVVIIHLIECLGNDARILVFEMIETGGIEPGGNGKLIAGQIKIPTLM